MGWFAIVKKFTNIAMFVWKFGIWNMVWTEPSRADSQIDRPPKFNCFVSGERHQTHFRHSLHYTAYI